MAVNTFVQVEVSPKYSASLFQSKMTLGAGATEDFILPTENILEISWSWATEVPTMFATTWPIDDVIGEVAHWDPIDVTAQVNNAVTAIRFVGGASDTELSINVRTVGV